MSTELNLINETPHFGKPMLCAGAVSKDGISLIHGDSLQALKSYGDNHFDIAIVDPPYGIGDKFKGGKTGKMNFNEVVEKDWDKVPPMEYWQELFRVSKNQIVWGGNYMTNFLPPSRCFIVWDKMTYIPSMSQIEMAWTSFDKNARLKKINSNQLDRFHPTQKPVDLYKWLFAEFAKEGDKIIDTHLGSGSSRIAANVMKMDFVGFEVNEEYFNKQNKRYEEFTSQARLF
jgi:site-specific DNA-methyltransferase (adenine-specific)